MTLFDHEKYDPNLDLPDRKKMSNKIYNQGLAVTQEMLNKDFPEFLAETGGYKGLSYKLCDVFNEYNAEAERQKSE